MATAPVPSPHPCVNVVTGSSGAVITSMETRLGHVPGAKRGIPTTTTLNTSHCTPKGPLGTVCVTHRSPPHRPSRRSPAGLLPTLPYTRSLGRRLLWPSAGLA